MAEKAGGVASATFFVPDFRSRAGQGRKRRKIMTLHRAICVVARLRAEVVRAAMKHLEDLKCEVQAALRMKSESYTNLLLSEELGSGPINFV